MNTEETEIMVYFYTHAPYRNNSDSNNTLKLSMDPPYEPGLRPEPYVASNAT